MKTLVSVVALAVCISTSQAQSRSEQGLFAQLITNNVAVSVSALDRVLKTPEEFSGGILYSACGVAFREKRLEDAGFLLYVARFRWRFDDAMFPPIGTGGNDPKLAMAACHQELGSAVNPALMSEPKTYAKVVARVKSWKPKVTARYEPGWEYSKKRTEAQAEQAVAADRKDFLDHMSGFSALLLDDTYFSAVKVVQDYNFKRTVDPKRPSKERMKLQFKQWSGLRRGKPLKASRR